MRFEKGVTPVVGTALLLGITVAAGVTVISTAQNAQSSVTEGDNLGLISLRGDLRVESCWGDEFKTKLSIRNSGNQVANLTAINVLNTTQEINHSFSQNIVGAGEVFTLTVDKKLEKKQKITLSSEGVKLKYTCDEIIRRNISESTEETDTTTLVESGGQDASTLRMYSPDRIGSKSISGYNGELCLGNECSYEKEESTDFDTSDDKVNRSGDEISGAIRTPKVTWNNSICVGNNCNQISSSAEGYLTSPIAKMKGPLVIQRITADEDLCFGNSC